MNEFDKKVVTEFRENGGKVGGMFAGWPLLLLHTVGARSGREHVNPLVYFPFEGRRYIVGSAGGGPKHPAWYHNLVATPNVTIEIGDGTEAATANVLPDEERNAVWPKIVAARPNFGEYEKQTTRTIPVIALDPPAR